ncbi:hypothetical protein ONZ43_g4114 [Nemania bipapillata]|uniref:Uncharacterized protein n=1 Tax=Nemania bipapillata TaxID=110536 RepID=A0ACC2IRH5_9PEZI|nr:hypothetical protein ONZ43_g4114 [Nemania bipapillata]
MGGFQKWLDKRLAIISYTVEASDASEDTGNSARTTGSVTRDMSGKKTGGAAGRPKRQLSDNNDPDDLPGGGDDNGRDGGGNKRAKKGQTETQRWNDIYLLLFPGADRNAIPSPYPDYDETATRSKNFERYKRVEKRIKKELPRLVRQRVERKFDKVEADMLHGINDIIRNCLADFFRNNMSQDEGSSATTPQTASRATTPGLTPIEEPHAPPPDHSVSPEIDISYLLDDHDLCFPGGLSLFDFDPQFDMNNGVDGYGVDKVSLDSGYVSTSTMTGFR